MSTATAQQPFPSVTSFSSYLYFSIAAFSFLILRIHSNHPKLHWLPQTRPIVYGASHTSQKCSSAPGSCLHPPISKYFIVLGCVGIIFIVRKVPDDDKFPAMAHKAHLLKTFPSKKAIRPFMWIFPKNVVPKTSFGPGRLRWAVKTV